MATTSSQTIGGYSSPISLCTIHEALCIHSDGSNWQIDSHHTATGEQSDAHTVLTHAGTSTTADSYYWERIGGTRAHFYGQVAATGTAPNSALYLALPTNFVISSATAALNHLVMGTISAGIATTHTLSPSVLFSYLFVQPSQTARLYVTQASGETNFNGLPGYNSGTGASYGSGLVWDYDVTVDIAGWLP